MKSSSFYENNNDRSKITSKEKILKKERSLKDRINERLAAEAIKNNTNFAQISQQNSRSKPIRLTDKYNKIESIYNNQIQQKEKQIPKPVNYNSKDKLKTLFNVNNNISSTLMLDNQKVNTETKHINTSQSFIQQYNSNNYKDNNFKFENIQTTLKTSISKEKNRRNNISTDGGIHKVNN